MYCQTHLEWTRDFDISSSQMPFWSLVVHHGPELCSFTVFQQVDIKSHGCGWTIHMVPEIQAEWSVKITCQAHQTGRVSMSYTVSLKVYVETSYGKVENYTLSEQCYETNHNRPQPLKRENNRSNRLVLPPVVWSWFGPVKFVGVGPECFVQSKVSCISCSHPHRSFSKLQFKGQTIESKM